MYHRNFPQLKPPSTETDPTKDVISKSTFPFAKKKKKKQERERKSTSWNFLGNDTVKIVQRDNGMEQVCTIGQKSGDFPCFLQNGIVTSSGKRLILFLSLLKKLSVGTNVTIIGSRLELPVSKKSILTS